MNYQELINVTEEDMEHADIKAARNGRVLCKAIAIAKSYEDDIRLAKRCRAELSRKGLSSRIVDAAINARREEVKFQWEKVHNLKTMYHTACRESDIVKSTLKFLKES